MPVDGLREALAAQEHEQWSGWMNYLFGLSRHNSDGTVTIPADKVAQWKRQAAMPYALLSEQEQASDRAEADKALAIVNSFLVRTTTKSE